MNSGAAKDRYNPVYKTLNKPLLVFGVERTLFGTALAAGLALFVLFDSFPAGIGLAVCLVLVARAVTRRDPQMLTFILNAGRFRARYDSCKYRALDVRRLSRA